MLLNGTPEQKKKLIREYLTGESESSSGDEFEKEMEAELSSTIRTMEGTWGPSAAGNANLASWSAPQSCVVRQGLIMNAFLIFTCFLSPAETGGGGAAGPGLPNSRMYDEVYFDSDSEEEDTPSKHECFSHHTNMTPP